MARFPQILLRHLAFFPLTPLRYCASAAQSSSSTTALFGSFISTTPRRHFLRLASASLLVTTTTSSTQSQSQHAQATEGRTIMMSAATAAPGTTDNSNDNDEPIDCGYLDAASAAALDEELMQTPGFTLEQLMELAGLSVAEAAYQMLTTTSTSGKASTNKDANILVICGPGNNGGDGLVAARHLHHFGFTNVMVVYPKRSSKQPHYTNLVQQCQDLQIPVVEEMPQIEDADLQSYGLIIDSIFGFSFKGDPREPFKAILQTMQDMQKSSNHCPILAVDVPSGWNVDEGDVAETGLVPDAVISLTAPKACMRTYTGRHFVGGRFLPPALAEKYNVRMPPYPGVAQVLQVSRGGGVAGGASRPEDETDSWRAGYAAYLAEKQSQSESSSFAKNDGTNDASWEAQYAAYCAEKEAKLAAQDRANAEKNSAKE